MVLQIARPAVAALRIRARGRTGLTLKPSMWPSTWQSGLSMLSCGPKPRAWPGCTSLAGCTRLTLLAHTYKADAASAWILHGEMVLNASHHQHQSVKGLAPLMVNKKHALLLRCNICTWTWPSIFITERGCPDCCTLSQPATHTMSPTLRQEHRLLPRSCSRSSCWLPKLPGPWQPAKAPAGATQACRACRPVPVDLWRPSTAML